jgi:hypothetical protein
MYLFRIVGGTDHTSETSQTKSQRDQTASGRISFRARDDAETLTTTNRNKRLRDQRKDAWGKAEAATRYWRAQMELQAAIWSGQERGISETARHPPTTPFDRDPLLNNYRKALVEQLLTPAPTAALVKWKQQAFAQGQYKYTDVKKERIEKAIADDLAFLVAHPARRARRAPRH